VEVYLLHFEREEMKFSGIEELKKQIDSDILAARKFFDERKKNSGV